MALNNQNIGADDFIRSAPYIPIKTYVVLDADNRPASIYQGPSEMKEGDRCILTTLVYKTDTAIVIKSKEELSVWPVGADI